MISVAAAPATTSAVPTVLVVDDDVSVRDSLELAINSVGWRPLVFDTTEAFLAATPRSETSCILLDLHMPGLIGLDLRALIKHSGDGTPVIFLSGSADVPMAVKALKDGAFDFITKPFDVEKLIEAIGAALRQSDSIRREQEELVLLKGCHDALTPREREVMCRVVRGLLNKQVAYELRISEITVKVHRSQVMRKMKARSLPDLVNMAAKLSIENGGESGLSLVRRD